MIHLTFLLVALWFAYQFYQSKYTLAFLGFLMYSISEFSYILYHINVTAILFSHTLAEISNFLGFLSLFMAISQALAMGSRTRP
jgi:hypothetical protein